MTTDEARVKISEEFMNRFYQWIADYAEMPDKDYGWKYGFLKNPNIEAEDSINSLIRFQKYIFNGRWLPDWDRIGYDKHVIWELNREGFLSHQMYSNWTARHSGQTDFFYISQKTAKEIYRASKSKRKGVNE